MVLRLYELLVYGLVLHHFTLAMVLRGQALSSVPLAFLRIVPLIVFTLLTRLSATERAKGRLWQNQYMSYGIAVSSTQGIFRSGASPLASCAPLMDVLDCQPLRVLNHCGWSVNNQRWH